MWHLGAKQTAMVFHGRPTRDAALEHRASDDQKDPQLSGGRTAQLLPPTGADTGGRGTVRVNQWPRGSRGVEVNEELCHVACRGVANGRRSGGTIWGIASNYGMLVSAAEVCRQRSGTLPEGLDVN